MKINFTRLLMAALILICSKTTVYGQIRSFSTDSADFIKEFEQFMQQAGQKKINEDVKVFKLNWSTGKFTQQQRIAIIRICNNMLMENLAVQPYFESFMRAMAAFLENKLPDKYLNQWQTLTSNMLGKGTKNYANFLDLIANLFETSTIYKDDNKQWTASNRDFVLAYEKGDILVKFAKLDLTVKGPADKIQISNTSGQYNLTTSKWEGKGGNIVFRYNTGDKPTAEITNYKINFKETEYKFDTVSLSYPKYFATKIKGYLQDQLALVPDTSSLSKYPFPKFVAFQNDLEIKNIVGPNATMKGGFAVEANEIATQSKSGQPTEITIYFKGKKKVTLRSAGFRINNGVAFTPSGSFVMYLDSGTIYHPNATIQFAFKDSLLKVSREDVGLKRVPFTDDYHKLDIDVQDIKWKINTPFVDFDNYQEDKEAKFASQDFFNEVLYLRLQGGLSVHPLQALNAYYAQVPEDPVAKKLEIEIKQLMATKFKHDTVASKSKKSADSALAVEKTKQLVERKKIWRAQNNTARIRFATKDWAAFLKTQPEYLQNTMYELHDKGYINYLPGKTADLDSAVILGKTFKHVQNHEKNRDYDVIRLSSMISTEKSKLANAQLDLMGNTLKIQGVLKFFFSDSQNVVVKPTDQIVSIKKDRRLKFGGMIRAGRFDFFGQKFEFDYDKFQVLYSNIDSMQMHFPDSTGRQLVKIKSVLRNIYGTLYIDKPKNKSGLMNFPEYPIFVSDKGSEILYDKPYIHGGAYKPQGKDTFKFVVDPFTIDSLDNFTIAGLQFDGTFKSAGIFPDFRHKASIQKDYSLGFITPTPKGGYPMYRGSGHGEMTMSLSEEGFYGINGKIDYAGSTTEFSKILLLPNKAVGTADKYDIASSSKFPEVHGKGVQMEWSPYDKQMSVAQGDAPFKVFKTGYDFYGKLNQTPADLHGDGTLKWKEADWKSKDMVLATNSTIAKSAALNIYAADSTKIAFETKDVNGKIDFDKQLGTFTTNIVGAPTKFPFNAYQTNLNDYKWNMAGKTIEAKIGPAMAGTKPYFLSINPDQDSLIYEGKSAVYDLQKYTLAIKGVPYIDIVDSRLFPKDGNILIREGAKMDPLDSAKILANRIDNFHDIYQVKITVLGRTKFKGTGLYQYVNSEGKRQEFKLDSITAKDKKYLEAWGGVEEGRDFTLDTKIGYYGRAQIISNEKLIRFLGLVKPLHTFKNVKESQWIRFDGRVDPKNVIIDIEKPKDKNRGNTYVGLYISNDTVSRIYPLFFNDKLLSRDVRVTYDTGILYYDHARESFFAGSKNRLKDGGTKGSYIQFNERDHSIHAEGPMNFGIETQTDSKVQFNNYGTADLKANDTAFNFNLAMMLNFPMSKDVKSRMLELFKNSGAGVVPVNNDFFKSALSEMIADEKNAKTIIKNLEKTGQVSGKDEAEYNFILTDANFRWDRKLRGMFCTDNVTLVSMGGNPLNMDVKVTMLLESKNSGQSLYLYFDLGGGEWIYFKISKNRAEMLASDQKLNEAWINTAEKTAVPGFVLTNTSQRMVDRFLKKFPESGE